MKNTHMRFWVLLGVLVFGGAVMNVWLQTGEAHVERQALNQFPKAVGKWQQYGVDTRFDKETEAVLRADDYLTRDYTTADGRIANFYVGYYASQRTGATYHSPLNCLPGSGWAMTEPSRLSITPADGSAPIEVNRYIIQKGSARQLLLYWYQGRGRAVASEYWGKIYTVIDSLQRRRSDGAMVRVMVPVVGSEAAALETAKDLAAQAAPQLSAYVPN
ncbi:MAG: EpsI family protein [Pyrinomonadaceae bacterium]|nr:EpsI family protein [Pyrinomonadaceae bacterium]